MPYLIEKRDEVFQTPDNYSFIGGIPYLPGNSEIPNCRLCGQTMTFYLQIQFPKNHLWNGKIVSLFYCTKTHHENHGWPHLPPSLLSDAVTPGFLEEYQYNFRILVYAQESVRLAKDYNPIIKYQKIELIPTRKTASLETRLGGKPAFRQRTNLPKFYQGLPFTFLMQFDDGWAKFKKIETAPSQTHDLDWERTMGNYIAPYYEFFHVSRLVFFGTENNEIYIMTG